MSSGDEPGEERIRARQVVDSLSRPAADVDPRTRREAGVRDEPVAEPQDRAVVRLILANLLRSKRRTFLTVFSIAIALFLSTVTDSSLGATLGAIAALVASQLFTALDAAVSVRPQRSNTKRCSQSFSEQCVWT